MLLPFGRLPELDLVAFRIDHPAERAVLGTLDLVDHVAAFAAQGSQQAVEVANYVAPEHLELLVKESSVKGLLRDITTILANEKVNVLGVASRSDTREQLATIDMTIEIYNLQVLGRVLGKLNQVPDVIDARRLHGG